jgi:hypothetical protein
MIDFLVQAYNFKKFPDPKNPPTKEAWAFEYGEFAIKGELPVTMGLTIYADSLAADTSSSTDYSEAFLSDMLTRLSEVLKLPDYTQVIRRTTYLSRLYVSTDKSLQTVNPKLNQIASWLSESIGESSPIEFGGMSFWADPSKSNQAPLSFERAIGASLSENRYYSSARLPTDKHLEVLNMLEAALS